MDDFTLRRWRRFDLLHEDALDVELQCYSRHAIEFGDDAEDVIHDADREVLRRFYSYEWTPQLEEHLVRVYDHSRGAHIPPYYTYWYFNIDKIVLGEWPLEKVPEHLRDIVKEARGE